MPDVPRGGLAETLVPAPSSYRETGGVTRLGDGMTIEAPKELAGVARWFRRVLEQATRWSVGVCHDGEADPDGAGLVRLEIAPADGKVGGTALASKEAYLLRIDKGVVTVTAAAPAGVFYGLQTLRQLLPHSWWRAARGEPAETVELAGADISDEPAFSWRGVHLDVSRHFMAKGFVLRLIELIAMHKCNVLHLHLTDDQGWRMPVAAYPRLVEVGAWRRESPAGHYLDKRTDGSPHGGYYSTEDLKEIVAYAAEHFVAVLPEIDMPGHMVAAIASYPELGSTRAELEVSTKWGISEHVLNLGPATVRFCTEVLDEVVGVFPWRFVHIGGDECPTTEWESSDEAQALMREEGFERESQLYGWFTAKMARHLSQRGRLAVGWDEILEGGAPPGAVVMSWRGEEGGIEAAKAGHDVVMAPEQWLYLDWAHADDPREPIAIRSATSVEKVWSYDPVPESMPTDCRHRVLGAQCELWTEYVPDAGRAEYMYFPRVCAFAEVVWSGPAVRDTTGLRTFSEFEARLRRHLRRLDALGVNYRPLDGPTPGQSRTWVQP
jgi:hexosaminidase